MVLNFTKLSENNYRNYAKKYESSISDFLDCGGARTDPLGFARHRITDDRTRLRNHGAVGADVDFGIDQWPNRNALNQFVLNH